MGDGASREMTEAEKVAQVLEETGKKLVKQEALLKKYESAFADLSKVLQERTYLIVNKETGEKHIGDLDEVFSTMIQHFKTHNTLDDYFKLIKIEKLKPETAAVLYGQELGLSK